MKRGMNDQFADECLCIRCESIVNEIAPILFQFSNQLASIERNNKRMADASRSRTLRIMPNGVDSIEIRFSFQKHHKLYFRLHHFVSK